jgi:antitoxin FitA
MASIVVRNLYEDVRRWLRMRTGRHGRTLEAEVRAMLEDSVREQDSSAEAPMEAFGELGGVELDLPMQAAQPRPVDLDDE